LIPKELEACLQAMCIPSTILLNLSIYADMPFPVPLILQPIISQACSPPDSLLLYVVEEFFNTKIAASHVGSGEIFLHFAQVSFSFFL